MCFEYHIYIGSNCNNGCLYIYIHIICICMYIYIEHVYIIICIYPYAFIQGLIRTLHEQLSEDTEWDGEWQDWPNDCLVIECDSDDPDDPRGMANA